MKKVCMLEEHEAREIGLFLSKLLAEEKKYIVRGIKPIIDIELLESYKNKLLGY